MLKDVFKNLKQHCMSGISYMIPVIVIGDNDREIVPEDIWKASLLMFLAEGILMVVLLMILAAVR